MFVFNFIGVLQNCPTRSYQGIWEIVLNDVHGLGYSMETTPSFKTKDEMFHLLIQNFERHYLTNRAPFGLHVNLSWLETKENLTGLKLFLDTVLRKNDVWLLTNWDVIQWIKTGTTKQWNCGWRDLQPQEIVCDVPNVCKIDGLTEVFYTCSECPKKYPWFRNEFGNV